MKKDKKEEYKTIKKFSEFNSECRYIAYKNILNNTELISIEIQKLHPYKENPRTVGTLHLTYKDIEEMYNNKKGGKSKINLEKIVKRRYLNNKRIRRTAEFRYGLVKIIEETESIGKKVQYTINLKFEELEELKNMLEDIPYNKESRINNEIDEFLEYLKENEGNFYTIKELCDELGISEGDKRSLVIKFPSYLKENKEEIAINKKGGTGVYKYDKKCAKKQKEHGRDSCYNILHCERSERCLKRIHISEK